MFKVILEEGTIISPKDLKTLVDNHRSEFARKDKLHNYYIGKTAILDRRMADYTKPNNKNAHPFASYLVDTATGYFMGQPVSYMAKNTEGERFLEYVTEIFDNNNEQSHNTSIATDASIYGSAYELLYLDAEGNVKFKKLDSRYTFMIYDNSIEENIMYGVRYYAKPSINTIDIGTNYVVELYTPNEILYYSMDSGAISYKGNRPHLFKQVPVVPFYNNDDLMGDFENVISLIDSYDKLSSDAINDFEYFSDAYLVLRGVLGTELEDVVAMKENRVLLLNENASAEWLVKNINDTYFQNTLDGLKEDIHNLTAIPNMNDKEFAGNLSGVAMKYKLMGLENKTSKKERLFKMALQRRLKLISNISYVLGYNDDYTAIGMKFTRNIPVNDVENANLISQLWGKISNETAISLLSFIENPAEELEKVEPVEIQSNTEGIEEDELE